MSDDSRNHSGATLHHTEQGLVIAAVRDVLFVLWSASPTVEQAATLDSVSRSLIARYGHLSCIHVAHHEVPLPGDEARRVLQENAQLLTKHVTAVAVVLLGHGFWASAARAFVTSLRWGGMTRLAFPVHVCATVEDATQWLGPLHAARSSSPPDIPELNQQLQELLARP